MMILSYLTENGFVIALLVVYVMICLYIGWHFNKKASGSVDEYYLAKREIPGWVISLAFFSTFASTNTYIGQAGMSFSYGLSWVWVGLFWVIFCILSWTILGPKMRNQTLRLGSYTIPDYFHYRYNSHMSKLIRVISAVIILFATLWYMVGIAKGCAHVLHSVLDIQYAYGAFLIIFITAAYTIWGGMYSVLWTDAIQGIMMFAVAIIMLLLPLIFAGGAGDLIDSMSNLTHPGRTGQPIGNGMLTFGSLTSFMYILGIGLAVGMKQISEPRCLIRFYSIDNTTSMKFAMKWTPLFLGISLICVMSLGALVHSMASPEEAAYLIHNTDEVVGFMLRKFDNQWVSGICVAGLFAAGMSSLASVILIVGTAFVRDVVHLIRPMPDSRIIKLTKIIMAVYCVLVFVVTLNPPAGIVELTAFAGAVFAASFFPSILGGLYWNWGTDLGAISSMIAGMICNVVWRFGIRFRFEEMNDIHEVIPSCILAMGVYIIASKLFPSRKPTAEYLDKVFNH